MKVIDLETAKKYLGITDDTQDAILTAYLPIIDAKVKQICNNNFNTQITCKLVAGSKLVQILGASVVDDNNLANPRKSNPSFYNFIEKELEVGTTIGGQGIDADSFISEIYYSGYSTDNRKQPSFELDSEATESKDSVYLYAGINIAYQPLIAKGLLWLTQQQSTTTPQTAVKSKRIGRVSKTLADDKIDGTFGVPSWLVKGLPRYMQ